ncbi:programmed cell death protein 7 [Drosophila eugracilis]|uniref:programmed cell death protein 7 n=1 Tax=Drosophila eugracilis TaxID=29029 RepID=UPI0007E6C08F|nr:programmed cell death protein 7 [Drosophila eugracilis]
MPNKNLKISEIKANINRVVSNLERLDQLSCGTSSENLDEEQAQELQRSTTSLLDELDQVPAQKVARIQKQRRRRRLDKQKRKAIKWQTNKQETLEHRHSTELPRETPKEQHADHISLRKQQDAVSILETFDLLEKLCESRGGDKAALSQKLNQMRLVWRKVQEETKGNSVKESKMAASIESQWDSVFFGKYSPSIKENKERFLQIRTTWDSYISYGERGSCIPRGWVLPPVNPSAEWAAYRNET